MNLDAVLRISAQVVGEENVKRLASSVGALETQAKNAKLAFRDVVNSSAFQAAAVAATGLGVAIGLSVKEAISFESAMADVRKVVNGLETPQGMKEIRQEIFALSREIPITAKGFAEMYAAAGQAGIARGELQQFATDVAKVAIAFDLTAAEAGNAMAKLRTNLGLTQPELMNLADAANFLSNNMASTAREIVEFMLRAGAAGKQAGLSAEQTAAFGSAMIASGAASEVAATSFNNMIKALSRGESMTDRQIGALVKLGYATGDAAEAEQRLTQAVEVESAKRMRALEEESRRAVNEIQRRYRDMQAAMQDGWDDDATAFADAQEDRYDAIIKGIQRERDARVEAARDRQKQLGYENEAEIQAIEDQYDEKLKEIRRQQRDEMTEYQRNARDKQQVIADQLDDEKQMELDAVEQKFEELKKLEELRKKAAIENAKETAKAMVGELGPKMAEMLQKDAVGTIRDVFERIRKLPAEMQMSVISDLFGDEARALLPLINNSKLLDQALGLVGDKSKYAGSTAKEFAARMQTTEALLQLVQNRVTELAIVFGDSFLPAIIGVVKVFAPLIEAFGWIIQNVPGVGPALAIVTGGFVALVAVSPFLVGFIQLLGMLKGALAAKAIVDGGLAIAGSAPVFKSGIQGILQAFNPFFAANLGQRMAAVWGTIKFGIQDFLASGFLKQIVFGLGQIAGTVVRFFSTQLGPIFMTGLRVVAGILSGPAGWILLAAGIAVLIYQFREQIGQFFTWLGEQIGGWVAALWEWGEPIREFWVGLWEQIKVLASEFWTWFSTSLYNWFVKPWIDLGAAVVAAFTQLWEAIKVPVIGFFEWWGTNLYKAIVEPWVALGTFIVNAFVQTWQSVRDAVSSFWTWFSTSVRTYIWDPIVAALSGIGKFFSDTWDSVKDFTVGFLSWWGTNLYKAFVEPIVLIGTKIGEVFGAAWDAIAKAAAAAWEAIVKGAVALAGQIAGAWNGIVKTFYDNVIKPIQEAWSRFVNSLAAFIREASAPIQEAWRQLSEFFDTYFVKPLVAAWTDLSTRFGEGARSVLDAVVRVWNTGSEAVKSGFKAISDAWNTWVAEPMRKAWQAVVDTMGRVINGFVETVRKAYQGIAGAVGGALNGLQRTAASIVNAVIDACNKLIEGVNNLRAKVGLSAFLLIPRVPVPAQFAEGGYVRKATLAVIGEGGESEYVVPESKMAQAARNYLEGRRGEAVLANPYRPSVARAVRPIVQPSSPLSLGSRPSSINITTGPVQQIGGDRFVTLDDLRRAVREASDQTQAELLRKLQQPSVRQRIGYA